MPTSNALLEDTADLEIRRVDTESDLPEDLDTEFLTEFLHNSLVPWEDTPEDIRGGIEYALSDEPGRGGLVLLGLLESELAGAVVVLDTGMGGYVPQFLLLFVAVDPAYRGLGIGGQLVEETIAATAGDVALHVEYENPAKRLYHRLGFRSAYAEMRYQQ